MNKRPRHPLSAELIQTVEQLEIKLSPKAAEKLKRVVSDVCQVLDRLHRSEQIPAPRQTAMDIDRIHSTHSE